MLVKMKRINDLHEKHNKFPDQKDIHLVYQLELPTKVWKFMGYRCVKCGHMFKREGTIPNHQQTCKVIKKQLQELSDYNVTILDTSGNIWKPKDFNQN